MGIKMPTTITNLRVFVASPSDVKEERDKLDLIIKEVNLTAGIFTNISLELIRWEKDITPDIGEDPQDVVNKQTPADFEIFIGIFWKEIGSPTARAESGTIEEFERTKRRYDSNSENVRIMLYFKESPPEKMSDIDPEKLRKVREFKERVSSDGAFYREFTSIDDFAQNIKMDLLKITKEWNQSDPINEIPVPEDNHESNDFETEEQKGKSEEERGELVDIIDIKQNDVEVHNSESGNVCENDLFGFDKPGYIHTEGINAEEYGMLDWEDRFSEDMDSLVEVIARMNPLVTQIGTQMQRKTAELNSIMSQVNTRHLHGNELKRHRYKLRQNIRSISESMDHFVIQMDLEVKPFKLHLEKGISAFISYHTIFTEINDDSEEINSIADQLIIPLNGVLDSMNGFYGSLADLPKLTSELNRSKKEAMRVIQEIIDVVSIALVSLRQLKL